MATTKRESIDMSATAIASRFEQVRALYKLMVSLGQIRVDSDLHGRERREQAEERE
jgi:hypothetical protein